MSNGNKAPAEDVKGLVSQTPLRSKIPPNEFIYARSDNNTNTNSNYKSNYNSKSYYAYRTTTNDSHYQSETTITDSDSDIPTIIPAKKQQQPRQTQSPQPPQQPQQSQQNKVDLLIFYKKQLAIQIYKFNTFFDQCQQQIPDNQLLKVVEAYEKLIYVKPEENQEEKKQD